MSTTVVCELVEALGLAQAAVAAALSLPGEFGYCKPASVLSYFSEFSTT